MPYTCPKCQKTYDVRPKWCPCTPYPEAEAGTSYILVDNSNKGKKTYLSPEQYEDLKQKLNKEALIFPLDDSIDTTYQLVAEMKQPGIETEEINSPIEVFLLTKEEYDQCLTSINT